MTSSPTCCPRCGTPLAPASPAGLCPRCLLAMNLRTRTMPTGEQPSSSPPPAPAELEAKFPQFEILECLGRGGMGVVYKARQKALDRIVAIKILAGEFQDDPGFASRFEKEAKLLARLNHPNIVTIHDFGHAGGLFHIVMEYIDGVNVRDLLRDGRLEPEQALAIVPPICDALQFAHDHGVVHRDIKPENILLDREGRVKIADFGIATIAGEAADRSGTPDYMAPEITGHGSAIDHRADIYSLGVVLYEMLTGRRPDKQIEVPSSRVHLDVKIDEIVLRALQGKPELRYQTAGEFKTVVATIATPNPPPPPPPAPATPAPTGVPTPEPVPLAAQSPASAPRELDQRLAFILLLAAFFGTPLLIGIMPPPDEGIALFLGLSCTVASLVFAIRARRSRTGRIVLAVWVTLIIGSAILLIVYLWPARDAAIARAREDMRQEEAKRERVSQESMLRIRATELDTTVPKPDPSAVPGLFAETDPGATQQAIRDSRVRIVFDDKGKFSLNGSSSGLKELPGALKALAAREPKLPVKILSSTRKIDFEQLAQILAACRGVGFTRLSVWNNPEDAEISPAPPILVTHSYDPSDRRSFTLDGSPILWKDLTPALRKLVTADPLREVRILSITTDRSDGPPVLLLSAWLSAGGVRVFYTTDPEEHLPAALAAAKPRLSLQPPSVIRILIAADGSTWLDGRKLTLESLSEELGKLKERNSNLDVEIEPDSSAPYSAVLPVLNLCHRAALTNVTILEAVMEDAPPLPVAGAGANPESLLPELEPIRIHIAADGSLKLGEESLTLEQLRDKLIAIARQGGTQRQVAVSGDAAVRAARIQEVMEVCGQADFTRISFEKAASHLREIDLAIALKSYEALQTRLRDARLERELLVVSGGGAGDETLMKAERLIATFEQQLTEERAMIEKLQSETAPDK